MQSLWCLSVDVLYPQHTDPLPIGNSSGLEYSASATRATETDREGAVGGERGHRRAPPMSLTS